MKKQVQERRGFELLEVRNLLSINPVLTAPYTPDEIRSAYGVDNITFGPAGNTETARGLGETIALIDSGDDPFLVSTSDTTASTLYPTTYAKSDLALFDNAFGLNEPFTFTVVGENGGARPSYKTAPAGSSGDGEAAMDVEWAHAMAPLATIVLIETSNDGIVNAVEKGVPAVGANVVSMSLGFNDELVPGLPVSAFNQPNVTFVAASGDQGTPASGPGDYPNVLDVAASDLTLNNDQFTSGGQTFDSASYNSEVGWSNPPAGQDLNENEGGSGGGYTLFPSSEASYQNGLVIHDGNQILSTNGERVTPDISFVGGSATSTSPGAVWIYNQGKLSSSGGTSLSSPCIAGLIAIADQGIGYGGFDSTTNANFGGYSSLSTTQVLDAIYGLPSYDYHDITSGFNGYSAGPGYDLVSGLGSPVANQWIADLARAAPELQSGTALTNNVVYAPMNYEAPEVYASAAAKTAITNNMTLQLNGSMIDLYDNSTGGGGLGTLVAADPLATTSEININGGDYAANSLTINFNNGNMIPTGGLSFDGTSYDLENLANEGLLPATGGPVGIPSLNIVGELPSGPWKSETVRPLSPTTGFITLGGTSNINYTSFANPGLATTPAIVDSTPASAVTYIALGSNIDTITILQGPVVQGVRSTQYESTGVPGSPLFTPVDFINKTGVNVADADGNDTVFVNFNNGNPLPASGLTFNGGTGFNTINVTGNHNFTLSSSGIADTTLGGGTLNFLNEQNFVLTGGVGNNIFSITSWTGQGTINGGGGQDTVEIKKTVNMGVNGSYVGASDGMLVNMVGIAATVLQGTGSGNYSFTVNAWNANSGALWLNGGTGTNIYYVGTPQTEDLDTILKTVDINAAGSSNALVLYDQKNTSFVNYTLSGTSVTSTLQTLQGGGSRPFAGVTVKSGAISTLTLNANRDGSTFNLTPSAATTFYVNGSASALTPNFLNINFAGAQSPTLFNTNSSGSSGIFMFANDKPVSFTNMSSTNPTDYTGSAGAINAVAATSGVASQPTVQIINAATGQTLQTLTNVYPAGYTGGVQVAIGDVNGDGIPDIIVAPGLGQSPVVKVYSVLTGALEFSFLAQASSYSYGLLVAVGDVTGNGRQDIITAAMGGTAFVNVFLNNGSSTAPFAAYSTSTPTIKPFSTISGYQGGDGGLAVGNLTSNAATSANPKGAGDIIVGSGIGTKAIAQVFNYAASGTSSAPALTITPTFSSSVTGGVSVAVADVNGDSVPDLVMGAGTGGGSLVDVWSGKTKAISQFTAFTGSGNGAAVHVAIAKINGVNDILVAQGIGGQSHQLKTFTASGAAVDVVMESSSYLSGGINLD